MRGGHGVPDPGESAPPGNPDPAESREPGGDGGPEGGKEPQIWSVDLHLHTSASYDCLSDPAEVVRAARERGLDRIAVTDHDEIEGALKARELDASRVIVGEEVSTAEGVHLIGLFLHRRIPPGWSFRQVAEAIHSQGGLVYLPHPLDPGRGADESFLDSVAECVDVVEGFNARTLRGRANERARRWAGARGLPVGAGSDAHLVSEVGRARVRLPPFRGPEGLLEALERGSLEGRTSGPWVRLGSTWAKLRKRLP